MLLVQLMVNAFVLGVQLLVLDTVFPSEPTMEAAMLASGHRERVCRPVLCVQLPVFSVVLAVDVIVRIVVLRVELFVNGFVRRIVRASRGRERNKSSDRKGES